MDQTNPLAEMTHKRRLSALGPGGLTRGACRVLRSVTCIIPITAGCARLKRRKGPNIGLISSMCIFARVNEHGFLETPYRRKSGEYVSTEVDYLSADDEEDYYVAQANAPLDESGKFQT